VRISTTGRYACEVPRCALNRAPVRPLPEPIAEPQRIARSMCCAVPKPRPWPSAVAGERIGAVAALRDVRVVDALPKTRSGKDPPGMMRQG